ncbi:MAG: EAL domain-containing protein, partial [Actinobacteria bacterium]|nr:EAL domain-containing protein [Actinomycetota bacterium]
YLVKGEATNRDIVSTLLRVARGEFAIPSAIGHQLLDELSTHLERAHIEEEIHRGVDARVRRVLAAGSIDIVYQPILDLASGVRRGVEALARFTGPPIQGPDRWFADAAVAGLSVELELLAVRSAFRALGHLDVDTYLAVNVSPATAAHPAFHAMILDGAPTETVMEVTEHAPIDDYDHFGRAIEPLRSAGVRLAVDDVGAGFASLRHILLLAPDIIKLDISLTRGVDADRNRRAMARALISFAAETEASIVAEGIETEAEREALRELGVSRGQGYLLGRPAPLEQLLATDSGVTSGR